MRKIIFCLFTALFLFILWGNPITVFASEGVQTLKIINSTNNMEVTEANLMLDNISEFTPEVVAEIEKYSDIEIQKLDDTYAQVTITNKIPEKINYYEDGTKEEFFTKTAFFGPLNTLPYPDNRDISPMDIYVEVRIKAALSAYEVGPAEVTHYRLISGSGGLLKCWENGYRNLVIKPTVMGGYENPDGSRGSTGWLYYTKTIAKPSLGTIYTSTTNNPNYYSSAGGSMVKVDVSIEWWHGENWENKSEFCLKICE